MNVMPHDTNGARLRGAGLSRWWRLTDKVRAGVPYIKFMLSRGRIPLPPVMGARGPLSARQAQAVLRRAGVTGADHDALARHLAIEYEVAETPLVAGHDVRVLRDGEDAFRAMFAAITGAESHINLEYYILEDISLEGLALSDLLIRKLKSGIAVNIIYDSFGSAATKDAFFTSLKEAGANLLAFNPLNPLKAKAGYSLNRRDHRKLLLVDGAVAIVGGINLSTTYQSGGTRLRAGEKPDAASTEYWRDTDLEIRGPAVAQAQRLFVEQWEKQSGPPLLQDTFYPAVPPRGTEIVRFLGSGPEQAVARYYVTLLSALRAAEKSIRITAAYFVPTRQERKALKIAAKRGVDVRLLLPSKSDAQFVVAAQRASYGGLLRAGVKIYETLDYVLHSKTVVIDSVWSVVGSSNCDHRSVLYNDELDAVVLGRQTAETLEGIFDDDAAHARRIDRQAWRRRPLRQRLWEMVARICERFL